MLKRVWAGDEPQLRGDELREILSAFARAAVHLDCAFGRGQEHDVAAGAGDQGEPAAQRLG